MPELGNRPTEIISNPTDLDARPVLDESRLASGDRERETLRAGWDEVIDRCLIEWGRDPSLLEDEGVVPPSSAIIRRAIEVARAFKEAQVEAPTAVVPDGTGGVAFERKTGSAFESLEIHADGSVELLAFKDSRLMLRRRLA